MDYQAISEHPVFSYIRKNAFWILIVFYTVGVIAIGIFESELFARSTPFILLLSVLLLTISHNAAPRNLLLFFLLSYFTGLIVEYIGIHTSHLFGKYNYGKNLGLMVYEVPLMIGINWFLLSFSAGYFIRYFFKNAVLRIFFAAGLMVFTDFFIEPVATLLDFWQWDGGYVPFTNYLHWFIISLFLQCGFYFMIKEETNELAAHYYVILTLFFVLINNVS